MFSLANLISLQRENYEEDEKIKILNSKKKKTVILNPNSKNQVFKIQLYMSKLHRYVERNEIVEQFLRYNERKEIVEQFLQSARSVCGLNGVD